MPRTVYFDYNATTPLDADVRAAMLPFLDEFWGNPSSVHLVGRKARALLDDARDRAAKFLGAKPSENYFYQRRNRGKQSCRFRNGARAQNEGKTSHHVRRRA